MCAWNEDTALANSMLALHAVGHLIRMYDRLQANSNKHSGAAFPVFKMRASLRLALCFGSKRHPASTTETAGMSSAPDEGPSSCSNVVASKQSTVFPPVSTSPTMLALRLSHRVTESLSHKHAAVSLQQVIVGSQKHWWTDGPLIHHHVKLGAITVIQCA